jgi:hypothetical protein
MYYVFFSFLDWMSNENENENNGRLGFIFNK